MLGHPLDLGDDLFKFSFFCIMEVLLKKPMPLRFHSRKIKRNIYIDNISSLTATEIILLKDELLSSLVDLDDELKNIAWDSHNKTGEFRDGWDQTVQKKKQVCNAFLEELQKIKLHESEKLFRKIYDDHITSLIIKNIGHEKYKSLIKQARENTINTINKIKNNQQEILL